jgi:hypothetical protein
MSLGSVAAQAAGFRDRQVRLKPVALAIAYQAARSPHPVTVSHHESVNVHAVKQSHQAWPQPATQLVPVACPIGR